MESQAETPKTSNPVRRLYDWVVSLADKPWALTALFFIAFVESSVFPIPPDVLLIPMVLGARTKAWRIAAVCFVGSILGGLLGYYIGYVLWHNSDGTHSEIALWFFEHIFTQEKFAKLEAGYAKYGNWAVFAAGLTPFPYKVITIFSGVIKMPLWGFILASILGRGGRFFLVAWLLKKYGDPMQKLIDKYFNILAIAFCILLGLGFYFLKMAH